MRRKMTRGCLLMALSSLALSGCMDKDVYNPNNAVNADEVKAELFDFDMTKNFTLDIDYGMSGSVALVEVYDEYPYTEDEDGEIELKDGINPVFSFNLQDGSYNGTLNLPACTSTIYLTTGGFGLPTLVEATVSDGTISYKTTGTTTRALSKTTPSDNPTYTSTSKVFAVSGYSNLYTLFNDWNEYGKPWDNGYITNISSTNEYDATAFNNMISRLQRSIWQNYTSKQGMKEAIKNGTLSDNSSRATTDDSKTNISIIESSYVNENGQTVTVDNAKLTLTFLDEYDQTSMNVFGYYYYKTGTTPTADNIKKFIVFPNVTAANYSNSKKYVETYKTNSPLHTGDQVVLKFMDDEGNLTDRFPAGYTIGWFIYYNGFDGCKTDIKVTRNSNANDRDGKESLRTKKMALDGTNNNKNGKATQLYYSNPSLNGGVARCMTISDTQSGVTAICFEDADDNTFDDLIFYVEADTYGTLHNNSGEETDGGVADHTSTYAGTYAFEDVWLDGGDYDMNDVVVEYSRKSIITCHNELRALGETYKVVHNGATYEDGFGVTLPYPKSYVKSILVNGKEVSSTDGDIDSYKGTAPRWEGSASSDYITLVLFDNIKDLGDLASSTSSTFDVTIYFNSIGSADSTYTAFSGKYDTGSYVDTDGNIVEYQIPIYENATTSRATYPSTDLTARNGYNPFVIVYSLNAGTEGKRCEVHLPKKDATSLGCSYSGDDAWNMWYVGRLKADGDRQYPFAIDIPVSCNPSDSKFYKVAAEKTVITEAYTGFAGWTDSEGSTGADWYLNPGSATQTVQAYSN
ncbi:MAG: LruC domain-containing protein [Bacteroides sp.]|nr:LruC domain-containing protein [Bacteroides sp.]